jgi:hypothetical protein
LGTRSGSRPQVPLSLSLSQENALVQEPPLQQDVTHLSSFLGHGIISWCSGVMVTDECVHILDEWKKFQFLVQKCKFQSA